MMREKSVVSLLLLPLIWGGYYVASQYLVECTSPFASGVGIRFVTLIFLTLLMAGKKELLLLRRIQGVWKQLILIGTLGFLLDWTAFTGLSMSSAASGTALLKCDVLMVYLMSMVIYRQRFTWKAWGFVLVMLCGVFLVMGVDFRTFQIDNPGNLFFLLSAFFVSLNAFVIKSVQTDRKNPICDDVVAYYNNLITMIYFSAALLATGRAGDLSPVAEDGAAGLSLLLAALGQTLVYVVYYYNLRNYEVWLVKTCLLLMPAVSAVVTFLLFGEKLVGTQYAGMAVVIAGAVGILWEQKNMGMEKERRR